MNDDELSPELRALFEAERRREGPPDGARERVHQALLVSLGVGALGAASSASATVAAGAAGTTAGKAVVAGSGAVLASGGAATSGAAAVTTATAAATTTATGGALAKGLAFALVTAMAGTAGTGVWLAQADEPAEKPTTIVLDEEPAPLPPSFDPSTLAPRPEPPPPPPEPEGEPPAAPGPEHTTRRVSRPEVVVETHAPPHAEPAIAPSTAETSPEQRAAALRGERAVLDEARAAVARGDGGAALVALEAHRAQFSQGALVEEREALLVLTLARLGRLEEARAKARAFQDSFPTSLMLPAVENAVR